MFLGTPPKEGQCLLRRWSRPPPKPTVPTNLVPVKQKKKALKFDPSIFDPGKCAKPKFQSNSVVVHQKEPIIDKGPIEIEQIRRGLE